MACRTKRSFGDKRVTKQELGHEGKTCVNQQMKKSELQSKLRDIHTLITRSMIAAVEADRHISDDLLVDAEDELNDLENKIALELE